MAQDEIEQGPWLSLSEASIRSGLHKEALRARAKRGQLPSRKNNLGQTLVQLPSELLVKVGQGDGQDAQGVAQGDAQAQVEQLIELVREMEQELAGVRLELAEAQARTKAADAAAEARIAAERAVAEFLREQNAREIARADRLDAEVRELRRPWWVKLLRR